MKTSKSFTRGIRIFVKDGDKFTVFRRNRGHIFAEHIRGKKGYTRGVHVWQFEKKGLRWDFTVGVATKYVPLDSGTTIGLDQEGYGWNINLNACFHDCSRFAVWNFPVELEGNGTLDKRDKLYCILDMNEGYLAFATDKQYLGVAFRGLKGNTLFPIVSTVWDNFECTMKYLGGMNLTDEPSRCSCKGCTRLVITDYCKDCSAECVIHHDEKDSGDGEEMMEKEEDGEKMEADVNEAEEVKETGCCCAMVKKAWNRLCRWTIRMYARSQELYHI